MNYSSAGIKIKLIKTREILDSKMMPTVEVELKTNLGSFVSSVPSGVSTGQHEAVELRDDDGRGVKKAIDNIERIIAPVLGKENLNNQERVDEILINLDGTKNKSHFGANAMLAVSIAVCRMIAKSKNLPLYKYISEISGIDFKKMPEPSFNMIEGGKHADSGLAFQEFMVVPQGDSFKKNFKTGQKVYQKLRDILEKKFGEINLSQEGAFSVPLKTAFEAIDSILEAGGGENIKIAIDAAGAEGENYLELVEKYPITSIEDPFDEEDFEGFAELRQKVGDLVTIFGDDLTVSNIERIKLAQEKNSCNGLILKPNQIGTVTETIESAKLAKSFGWKIMVANRAGETKDDFIADLAVGLCTEFIKSGAPFPKERMAKYNRLVKIEEEIYG